MSSRNELHIHGMILSEELIGGECASWEFDMTWVLNAFTNEKGGGKEKIESLMT